MLACRKAPLQEGPDRGAQRRGALLPQRLSALSSEAVISTSFSVFFALVPKTEPIENMLSVATSGAASMTASVTPAGLGLEAECQAILLPSWSGQYVVPWPEAWRGEIGCLIPKYERGRWGMV